MARVNSIGSKIADAFFQQDVFIHKEISGTLAAVATQDIVGCIAHDIRRTGAADHIIAPQEVLYGCRCDCRAWPKCIDCHAFMSKFFGQAINTEAHTVFRHRISQMCPKPFRLDSHWRGKRQDVGVIGFEEVGQTSLGAEEGPAGIHLVHEVVALHRRVEGIGKENRAGIVDQDINTSERFYRFLYRRIHLVFKTDIHDQRKCFSACSADFLCGGINRTRKGGMWVSSFSCNHNICTFFSQAKGDRKADAPAGTCNKNRFVFEAHIRWFGCLVWRVR